MVFNRPGHKTCNSSFNLSLGYQGERIVYKCNVLQVPRSMPQMPHHFTTRAPLQKLFGQNLTSAGASMEISTV